MNFLLAQALRPLDELRFACLRMSMRIRLVRSWYFQRAQRLFLQHLCAFFVFLPLAIFFPLYLLVFGPMFYGLPHVFASIRYLPHFVGGGMGMSYFLVFVGFITAASIQGFHGYNLDFRFVPLIVLLGSFLAFAWIYFAIKYRPFRNVIAKFLIFIVLMCAFIKFPLHSAATMVIFHNFVAYGFWWKSLKTRKESLYMLLCFGVFVMAHLFIFCGFFDHLGWDMGVDTLERRIFGMSLMDIGGQIIDPFGGNRQWISRAAIAYAFGQSMHYFVWLKAIPEQHLNKQGPTAFRESFRLLRRDFGEWGSFVAVIACVGFLALHGLQAYPDTRYFYLLLAASHGYSEITALIFAESRL